MICDQRFIKMGRVSELAEVLDSQAYRRIPLTADWGGFPSRESTLTLALTFIAETVHFLCIFTSHGLEFNLCNKKSLILLNFLFLW